jgi:hypothetical protein
MVSLLASLVSAAALANQPDIFFPHYLPPSECTHGCAAWKTAPSQGKDWDALAAGSVCAIPGAVTGSSKENNVTNAWGGPFCFCAGAAGAATSTAGYCRSPLSVPEQINLQLANEDTVVVSFVTYEQAKPTRPPEVIYTKMCRTASCGDAPKTVTGVTHWYEEGTATTKDGPHTGRNFSMHFVKLGPLEPRTEYSYQVRGGAEGASTSPPATFRSAYTAADGGETRVAIFGDMAVTQYNAVSNLAADCAAGTIDAIWMMGDHAYDLGQVDDRRGDAYMNGIAPATSTCPWVPVIGNHEASDGDHYNRYLNQTWGEAFGNPAINSTADTALGHLLSKGTLFGASSHGSRPSGTSRYFSVDIGLIHFVGLDLNAPETSPRAIGLDAGQLSWLDQDLAAAQSNRETVPWIVVTSHFPIYLGGPTAAASSDYLNASAAYYASVEAEAVAVGSDLEYRSCRANGEPSGCKTVGDLRAESSKAIEPMLVRYGVDVYAAGHSHIYGVTWPMVDDVAVQTNYSSPKATVYVTEGNGGVPGAPGTHKFTCGKANGANADCKQEWMRTYSTGGAYGRLRASNDSVLTYEHVFNNGNGGKGQVMETWSITDATHVFPPAPPPAPGPAPAPPAGRKPDPPAGMRWVCADDIAFSPTPAEMKLRDTDVNLACSTSEICQENCNAIGECVALRYHAVDKHCHALVGKAPPSAEQFAKLSKNVTQYVSCYLAEK